MRSILLFFLGVPIPIIILIALLHYVASRSGRRRCDSRSRVFGCRLVRASLRVAMLSITNRHASPSSSRNALVYESVDRRTSMLG